MSDNYHLIKVLIEFMEIAGDEVRVQDQESQTIAAGDNVEEENNAQYQKQRTNVVTHKVHDVVVKSGECGFN